MLDFKTGVFIRALATRYRNLELLDTLFLIPALERPSPVVARVDDSPVEIALRVVPNIRRQLGVGELKEQTLKDIFSVRFLPQGLSSDGKHERVVLHEELVIASLAVAFIVFLSIRFSAHSPH